MKLLELKQFDGSDHLWLRESLFGERNYTLGCKTQQDNEKTFRISALCRVGVVTTPLAVAKSVY